MELSLSLNIKSFFCLTKTHRDIVRYLFWWEIRKRKKNLKKINPRIRRIASAVRCSVRTVQRFNKSVNGFLFDIQKDFRHNKSTTSNTYKMDEGFFQALCWLDRRNLLRIGSERFEEIINEVERYESPQKNKMSPPTYRQESTGECHPHSLSSSSSLAHARVLLPKSQNKSVYYCLENIEIPIQDKKILSLYPERAVVMALEDLQAYRKWGNRPDNLPDLLKAQTARHAGTRTKRGK